MIAPSSYIDAFLSLHDSLANPCFCHSELYWCIGTLLKTIESYVLVRKCGALRVTTRSLSQSELLSESSLSSGSLPEASLSLDESDAGSGFFFLLSVFAFGFLTASGIVFLYLATSFL